MKKEASRNVPIIKIIPDTNVRNGWSNASLWCKDTITYRNIQEDIREIVNYSYKSYYCLFVEQLYVGIDGVFYLAYFDKFVGGMTACALARSQFQ